MLCSEASNLHVYLRMLHLCFLLWFWQPALQKSAETSDVITPKEIVRYLRLLLRTAKTSGRQQLGGQVAGLVLTRHFTLPPKGSGRKAKEKGTVEWPRSHSPIMTFSRLVDEDNIFRKVASKV